MDKNIICVKQLPIIEERLKLLSDEIEQRTKIAVEMVCTEDTVKEVKQVRAELNKQFSELEDKRKSVKKAVLEPYEQFESAYKKYVSEKFRSADGALKGKINDVESELKKQKEAELKSYFEELKSVHHVDWLPYGKLGIHVTLSASMKSLKEQVKTIVEAVEQSCQLINSMPDSEEILLEYQNSLSLNLAVQTVRERKDKLLRLKEQENEYQGIRDAEETAKKKVEAAAKGKNILQPPKHEEKLYQVNFSIIGTIEQLKALKTFLDEGGYKYEQ